MVRLGRTYSNLMAEASATNDKLRVRRVRMLREASGADEADCEAALTQAGGDLPTALVALLAGVGAEQARRRSTPQTVRCGARSPRSASRSRDARAVTFE